MTGKAEGVGECEAGGSVLCFCFLFLFWVGKVNVNLRGLQAEHLVISDPKVNHEYLAQRGLPEFSVLATELLYGKEICKEKHVGSL